MAHRLGFRIHYFLVFMVFVACVTQVENQEGESSLPDSTIDSEIFILPPRSLYTMAADFDMRHFCILNNMDSMVTALKQESERSNAVFSSTLPPVPTWMDETNASDSLYRSAYLKYVKRFVEEFNRLGLPITTLYIERDSRESRFVTVEELSTSVKCQLNLTDSLPNALAPHRPWTIVTDGR